MSTIYNRNENTITTWANVPLEAFQRGEVASENVERQLAEQIGVEIGRNGLGEIEQSENHRLHTMDVKLTVAVLSMEKYREMNELISDLTNDNAEMLETIESLQSGLEASERENEQLRLRVSDLELKLKRGEPYFKPSKVSGMLPDDWFRKMHEQTGFRGGKRP